MHKALTRSAIAILAMLLIPPATLAQRTIVETESHRFEEFADDVWFVSGTGTIHTMSNVMVLVGAFDTLVVDSHVTPAAARALIDSLPAITDKPVRYLVNSHYHFDHAHGNQAFPEGIEIIGHEFTRKKLNGEIGNVLEENTFKSFSDPVPSLVAILERELEGADTPESRSQIESRLKLQTDYMNAIPEVQPTPPNITLDKKLTLFQVAENGSREIQLLHFGRAHTGGDVVIYLPQEKVLFTGDMLLPFLSYMGDGHVDEWPDTLEGLKSLDFDLWLGGHGPVMESKQVIDNFQDYLRELWMKTTALYEEGVAWEEAATQIDMTSHSSNYPQIQGPGIDPRAVRRMYELLDTR